MARLYKLMGKFKESWILDYTDANKRRHRRVIGHTDTMTKKQAERIRVEREREKYYQKEGIPIFEKIPTIKFFNRFRTIKKRSVNIRTMKNYASRINYWEEIHLRKSTEFTPLSRIDIDEAIGQLQFRPKTVNHYIVTLKQIYRYAEDTKIIQENPTKNIKPLYEKGRKIPRFFSRDEIEKIIQISNGFYSDLFTFLLYTGMRKDEVRFLEWNDIDLEGEIIRIRIKDDFSPKTKKGRNVPMHPKVKEILMKRNKETNLIFPSPGGGTYTSGGWWSYLKRKLNKLNIKNASPHTFRHTFASWLAMEGVEIRTIAEILGHSRIETTMIYSHLTPDHVKKAVERLPEIRD